MTDTTDTPASTVVHVAFRGAQRGEARTVETRPVRHEDGNPPTDFFLAADALWWLEKHWPDTGWDREAMEVAVDSNKLREVVAVMGACEHPALREAAGHLRALLAESARLPMLTRSSPSSLRSTTSTIAASKPQDTSVYLAIFASEKDTF